MKLDLCASAFHPPRNNSSAGAGGPRNTTNTNLPRLYNFLMFNFSIYKRRRSAHINKEREEGQHGICPAAQALPCHPSRPIYPRSLLPIQFHNQLPYREASQGRSVMVGVEHVSAGLEKPDRFRRHAVMFSRCRPLVLALCRIAAHEGKELWCVDGSKWRLGMC